MSIFSDMIEEIMEVFMDDFSIYGTTFDQCLEKLDSLAEMPREGPDPQLGEMSVHGM